MITFYKHYLHDDGKLTKQIFNFITHRKAKLIGLKKHRKIDKSN